ncbi:MAG: HEAT repeat domain-containing protein [Isosphaeraceae bacterium]
MDRIPRAVRVGCGLLGAAFLASTAQADRIQLKSGGELKGVVVADPAGRENMVGVLTERSANPLPIKKEQVAKVIEERNPLREYIEKAGKVEDDAQAHFDLGLWCESKKMPGPAEVEFRKAADIDPQFGPARKKLGHSLVNDQWMTPDEIQESKGLVKFRGRWVTPEEKERRELEAANSAEVAAWTKKLMVIRQGLRSEKPDVRKLAEDELADIKDPVAIPALLKVLGRENSQIRFLLYRTLHQMEGQEASNALVSLYLQEPDPGLHPHALGVVGRRPVAEVAPRLVQTLKSNKPDPIAQSARALAQLKAETAIPNLIPALFQYRDRVEMIPVEVTTTGPSMVMGKTQAYAAQAIPSVAPGAVAYNIVPNTLLNGFAMGGTQTRIVEQPQMIRDMLPNPAVHDALVTLTGEDFGYDMDAWKAWLGAARRVKVPERRVPNP